MAAMSDEPTPLSRDRDAVRSGTPAARRRGVSWSLAAPLIGIVVIVAALLFAFTSGLFSPAVPQDPPATSAPVPEITETPAPPSSREEPAPANSTLAVQNDGTHFYDVAFGPAVLDGSAAVRESTRYYRDPDPGFQYLLVPMQFTYRGTTTGTPRIDLGISFLASDGRTYEGTSSAVDTPAPIANIVKAAPGAPKNAQIVIMVPSKDVAAGSIIIAAPDGTEYVTRVQ